MNSDPQIHRAEIMGLVLWVVAFFGESMADAQLRGFKANPANRGKICESGLWCYSRHPNYFFECLIWLSYFVFAMGSPGGIFSIISPALMIFFLVKVSGVPPAEAESIRSRGDAYREYQKTTSMIIPWFKKGIS